jgi:hypothetical protein
MGIEPTFEAWEAPVLPLNYTRGRSRQTPSLPRRRSRNENAYCRAEIMQYIGSFVQGTDYGNKRVAKDIYQAPRAVYSNPAWRSVAL